MIRENQKFTIYFGDNRDAISKSLDCVAASTPLIAHKKFAPIFKKIGVDNLAFLNQAHGIDGTIVRNQIPAFDIDGDYLITREPNIGIGVMTADCLPIILYDQKNHAAAIVHAGWRGTVSRIVQEVIRRMRREFGAENKDLQVFFGPSAKACCYQVAAEFKEKWFDTMPSASLTMCNYTHPECEQGERIEGSSVFIMRDNKLYFDLAKLNAFQLQEMGIPESALSYEYNSCTICDHRFYSYRRQGELAGRQMSIISLNY